MSRKSVLLFTTVFWVVSLVQSRADDKPAAAPAQTGAITGLVADWQGHPVAGAEVWGLSYQQKSGPTRTGPDGRFRLSGLKPDKPVTVWADVPTLARERRDDIRIFPGKDHDLGRLTLLPGTRMKGRVVDSQGKPIGAATVKLDLYRHQLGHTITSNGTQWKFTAESDGHFDTPPLPAGSASFGLSAFGKVRTFFDKKSEPGTPLVELGDITLPDETPVKGIVLDSEGKPAPRVQVVADYDWDHFAITDKAGRFTLNGVGKNLKILQLQSNAYFAPKPFDVAAGQTDLKLTVIKAYEIHGTAVDAETGKPVPIDTVRLCTVRRDPDDGHVSLAG